ncbi:MAG TPA: MerR family transcriptional regulator [Terriglobales bacterium]|nr:MerR family transcriptional regulator [Terriglobales bacterium]
MLSVTQIARRSGLSRTTILYYEACGLLKPALRTEAQYRLYGDKELRILEQILLYRSVGMSVRDIRLLLSSPETKPALLLKRRLRELDTEIQKLRGHQQLILRLLRGKNTLRRTKTMTKEKWISIMKAAGFSESDMGRWHQEFERSAPDDHLEFLQYLHIPAQEIQKIREWSRKPVAGE